MKYLTIGNCPFCDAEIGSVTSGWGMSHEGWKQLRKDHEAGHPNNQPPQMTSGHTKPLNEGWKKDFWERFKGWILQDDQEVYRNFSEVESFVSQLLATERKRRDGEWKLALTHLPFQYRESVLATLDAIADKLKGK